MNYPDANTIFDHWDKTPQKLRDVISDVDVMALIENIAKEYHINEDKEIKLERLIRFVFLGIIHRQDLQKEIHSFLNIDNRVALDLYGDLDRKILYHYHNDIDKNYTTFLVGANKEKAPDVVVGKKQVVLKEDIDKNGQTLDLRKKSLEGSYGTIGQIAPKKINLIDKDIENQLKNDEQIEDNKKDSINLLAENDKDKSTYTKEQIKKKDENTSIDKNDIKKKDDKKIEGPVILHRRDEIKTVGSDKKYTGYKNVSAGGVLGSFGTPFGGSDKHKDIVGANVEMPINTDDKAIAINKKNDKKVKVINYSELKSNVSNLATEEINTKSAVEDIVGEGNDLKNNKPDDDREVIDLSSMKIINK